MKAATLLANLVSIALIPLLLPAAPARAENRESILKIETSLEQRLTPIVRTFDPKGVVTVKATEKKQETETKALPGTPFMVKDLAVKKSEGEIELSTLDITVFTHQQSFPSALMDLMRRAAAGLGAEPRVRHEFLPANTLPEEPVAQKEKEQERAPAAEAKESPELVLFKQALEKQQTETRAHVEKMTQMMSTLGRGLMIFGAVCAAGFLVALWMRKSSAKRLLESLDGGLQKLSASMSESGDSRGLSLADAAAGSAGGGTASADPVANEASQPANFPDESLLACLSDCYWGQMDAYAAFLWKRIPADRKKSLLAQLPYLADYASYIRTVQEKDLGAIEDPTYLSPLSLWLLDNASVTQLVREEPRLVERLSPLRIQELQVSVQEKISLTTQGAGSGAFALPDLSQVTPSEPRTFAKKAQIQIRSVEEEREVLSIPGLGLELIEQLPSLGWLARLAPEAIGEILRPFSARDLAAAWTGPEEVLSALEKTIPAKKLEIMKSYQKSIAADRGSDAFRRIHASTVQWMKKQSEGGGIARSPNAA